MRRHHPHLVAIASAAAVLTALVLGPLAWTALHDKHDDGEWVLQDSSPELPSGLTITIEGGEIRGRGPCNSFRAAWSQDDATSLGDGIQSTVIGCARPVAQQEETYFDLLAGATNVAVDDDLLVLTGPNGRLTYARR